jgi:hypothetical protein
MPNDTPPELENVTAVALTDDAPAETLNAEMSPAVVTPDICTLPFENPTVLPPRPLKSSDESAAVAVEL